MLILFVTVVVIHIYSSCALGPAKNSVHWCCMQKSSCCLKKFTNRPKRKEREEGSSGVEHTAGDDSVSTSIFFSDSVGDKSAGEGAGQKAKAGQVWKDSEEESQGQHFWISFAFFYQDHTGVNILVCVTDASTPWIWICRKSMGSVHPEKFHFSDLDQCRNPLIARSCFFLHGLRFLAATSLPISTACWFMLIFKITVLQWQQDFSEPVVFTPRERSKEKTINDGENWSEASSFFCQIVPRCLLTWRTTCSQPPLPSQSNFVASPDPPVASPTTFVVVNKTSSGLFSELHGMQHSPCPKLCVRMQTLSMLCLAEHTEAGTGCIVSG